MDLLQIGVAFLAGILSFISPCVLAVAPGYLGMIGGEISGNAPRRWRALSSTLLFVLGFSVVFILLGTAFSFVGQFFRTYREWLTRVMGGVVMVFAFYQLELLRIPWLYREKRIRINHLKTGPFKPILIGMAFAFGWTPCVGPILGMILALAGSAGQVSIGLALLTVYSLGVAVPFVGLTLALTTFRKLSQPLLHHARFIQISTGILLLVMGLLLSLNQLTQVAVWLNRLFGGWSPEAWL